MFARLGSNGNTPPGTESPVNLSTLNAKLEAAKYESKYGGVVDRKKATPTQTKVTVTGLGKLVVSSSQADVSLMFISVLLRFTQFLKLQLRGHN